MDIVIDIYKVHEKIVEHLFKPYSEDDIRFLTIALCGETGELANKIKKRWRDGLTRDEEIRDEIADIRIYLELIARCFGIEGKKLDQRVQKKLEEFIIKRKAKIEDLQLK